MIETRKFETIDLSVHNYIAELHLNRPEAKNAMNYRMVEELTDVFEGLKGRRDVRCIVIAGRDGTFCAGGDIKEMASNPVPPQESGGNLERMLRACNEAEQVVIAKIEGAALGGGLGLVCVSDIAIAAEAANFGMPEVRLGIAPAFISPYVLNRIGLTRSRELMLTGRRFKGQEALAYGLIHYCYAAEELDQQTDQLLEDLKQSAPGAIAAIKGLIFEVYGKAFEDTARYRAGLLDDLRQGVEAQEGMMAFIQKRKADWAMKGSVDD